MKSFIAIALVLSVALAPEIAVAAGKANDAPVQRPVAKPATSVPGAYIGW
jgi:hypothetical protein